MRWQGGSERRRPTAWAAYRAGGLCRRRSLMALWTDMPGVGGCCCGGVAGGGGRGKRRGTWQAGKALGADVLSPDTTVLASTLEDGVEDVPLSAPVNGPRWKTSPGIRRFNALFSTLSQVGTSSKTPVGSAKLGRLPKRLPWWQTRLPSKPLGSGQTQKSAIKVCHAGRRVCQTHH